MQAEQKNKANFGDIVMREIEVKLTLKEACKKYSALTVDKNGRTCPKFCDFILTHL